MNPVIKSLLDECITIEHVVGAFGELEVYEGVDVDQFAELCSEELEFVSAQRDADNRKIELLTTQLAMLQEEHNKLLNHTYSKDPIRSLYEVWMNLPCCPLLSVVSGAIQDLQYYKEQHDVLTTQMESVKLPTTD